MVASVERGRAEIMMGLWFELTGRISEDQLRDFDFMSTIPLGELYPLGKSYDTIRPEMIVITVVNRLCHLIFRMERLPHYMTGSAARWYNSHFHLISILPQYREYIDQLRERLMRVVHEFEERDAVWADPEDFGRMVGSSDNQKRRVLYGQVFSTHFLSVPENPVIWRLHRTITAYCWQSGYHN